MRDSPVFASSKSERQRAASSFSGTATLPEGFDDSQPKVSSQTPIGPRPSGEPSRAASALAQTPVQPGERFRRRASEKAALFSLADPVAALPSLDQGDSLGDLLNQLDNKSPD
jgi:hypothetical protein